MNSIKLRGIVMEDFTNYKRPSLFLITSYCDFKCCHEGGFPESVCQNEPIIKDTNIKAYDIETIAEAYLSNDITKAIVIGGLEPFLQFEEIKNFIQYLRWDCDCMDDIVIYTGYYPEEITDQLLSLTKYDNIIVKFGRYIPNSNSRFDPILGITLASENQWAEVL